MRTVAALATLALVAPVAAYAQGIREDRVHFERGASGATRAGRLQGDEIVDYVLRASAGQRLIIDFTSSNAAGYFNLLPGTSPVAIHIGSSAGNHYEGALPADGDYRIRVYLMRSAARRNEATDYSLTVRIGGGGAPAAEVRDPDFADGLSGGPDWWRVAGVPAGDTLNVRADAGTAATVVGALANGDAARNLGCTMLGTSKWCRIEAGLDQKFTGWVNGRYLVEGAAPQQGVVNSQASGEIPCATAAGQPTGRCAFRVTRGGHGNADVWITLPAGGERWLRFRAGAPMDTDPGKHLSFERTGDLFLIRIDDVERYEIPDAVVDGG